MTFPVVPLAATVELLIGGTVGWVDITSDVRLESAASGGGIQINRGRSAEGNQADPGRCLFTIDNRSGRYSPRNPMGEWYGLFGRNTPVRVGVDLAADSFTRTVGAAWGQTDDGRTWSVVGTSSEYSVAGSYAVQQHPTKGVNHYAYLDRDWQDIEQVTSASVPAIPVGASVVAGHLARYDTATGDHYWLRLVFTPDATIWVQILKQAGGIYTTLLTKTGVGTFTAGQLYNLRSGVCGSRLSVKAWPAGTVEPVAWTATVNDRSITTPGRGGLVSRVDSGNTNTSEVRFDNYRATDRRFFGEVTSWPIRWDVGGFDRWVPVEASGILRRLNQGQPELRSALYRQIMQKNPTAYWPMEDLPAAVNAASAVAGVAPLAPFGYSRFQQPGSGQPVPAAGTVKFGSGDGIPGSAPVVDLTQGGVLTGAVPSGSSPGWRLEWVMTLPRDKAGARIPLSWNTSGTWDTWEFQVESTGIFATFGTGPTPAGSASVSANLFDGLPHHYEVEAFQVGGLTDARIYIDDIPVGQYLTSGSTPTGNPGSLSRVVVNPLEYTNGDESMPNAFGHVAVWNKPYSGLSLGAYAAQGWAGEKATDRMVRLAAEEGLPLAIAEHPDRVGTAMGPQGGKTLLGLLAECADADGGVLFEQRDGLGLVYRAPGDLFNQTPVALDYGQLSPPFEPVEDDSATLNDITATRDGGEPQRVVLSKGPLSVEQVGRYAASIEPNVSDDGSALHLAGWRLHLGTTDEARYPSITVDFTSPPWVESSPSLAARAHSVDSGDVVSLANLPAWVPPGPVKVMVRGYTETLDAFRWDVTWNAVPGSPWDVATVDGPQRVGADGSALAAPITSAATTLQIASTGDNGPWTTDPADFPLDIRVGGERVTLSAISGAASPQTATVFARGANGIQRAWAEGTEVDVWQPAIVAY